MSVFWVGVYSERFSPQAKHFRALLAFDIQIMAAPAAETSRAWNVMKTSQMNSKHRWWRLALHLKKIAKVFQIFIQSKNQHVVTLRVYEGWYKTNKNWSFCKRNACCFSKHSPKISEPHFPHSLQFANFWLWWIWANFSLLFSALLKNARIKCILIWLIPYINLLQPQRLSFLWQSASSVIN
jgi:hypothetical protein